MKSVLKEMVGLLFWASVIAVGWSSIFATKFIETTFFPVVKDVEITEVTPTTYNSGISVYLRFNKVRSCEYLKVVWYDQEGDTVTVGFNNDVGTRPPTENEVGPWFVGIPELEGSTLYVQHRCHPLWTQFTKMYP